MFVVVESLAITCILDQLVWFYYVSQLVIYISNQVKKLIAGNSASKKEAAPEDALMRHWLLPLLAVQIKM